MTSDILFTFGMLFFLATTCCLILMVVAAFRIIRDTLRDWFRDRRR